MIFGNLSRFAIEFELDSDYGGEWLFGKFCFWIKNVCIGDYNMGTSLRDVLGQMTYIIGDSGNRMNQELFNLNASDLFNRIDTALYGSEDCQYEKQALEEVWARFEIKIHVDIFDDWKIYLVENEDTTRVIVQYLYDVKEFTLLPKEFDEAIIKAYKKLNELYENEIKNCH